MLAKEARNMNESDLQQRIVEEKSVLAKMKFSHKVSGTENPMTIRMKRKEIARMITVQNERKNSK